MAPRKIIIDTDPGVDDVLALLLAFAALPEDLEILLVSVTFGNVDLQSCLRNVVSVFHHIEQERKWRTSQGRNAGFETLVRCKPLVAVGAEAPLADQMMMADFFHGHDGLGGIHESHPHLSPADTWRSLFDEATKSSDPEEAALANVIPATESLFKPSKLPAHEEILRLLRDNDKDCITIVAIGPLTNLARAAAVDTEAFLRVKEVVVMGSTINKSGNITPVAEFNTYADSVAAARVYALTSPSPSTTMPPTPPAPPGEQSANPPPPSLAPYPEKLSRQLNLTLFPLDITNRHELTRGEFDAAVKPLLAAKSPLAEWVNAFLSSTFHKIESLTHGISGDAVGLQLHDPLCIWYVLTIEDPKWKLQPNGKEDLRVETSGQWTRGMCVVDRRNRRRREGEGVGERPGDTGDWLGALSGNRLGRCVGTPGENIFGTYLLQRLFDL